MRKQLAVEGADIVRISSSEFAAFIASEIEKWRRVVRQAHIKAE